jgi:hypothetical protein
VVAALVVAADGKETEQIFIPAILFLDGGWPRIESNVDPRERERRIEQAGGVGQRYLTARG